MNCVNNIDSILQFSKVEQLITRTSQSQKMQLLPKLLIFLLALVSCCQASFLLTKSESSTAKRIEQQQPTTNSDRQDKTTTENITDRESMFDEEVVGPSFYQHKKH